MRNTPAIQTLRPARSADAERLTDLAMRSKAHWGYDEAFMAACRAELTITPARIEREVFIVAEQDGEIAGCAGFSFAEDSGGIATGEVEDVFVEPASIGSGLGGRLMTALLEAARARGLRRLFVDSDPNAVGFYENQGFRRIGEAPSGSIPGRTLPRLVQSLE